jgi:hypothetical protein
MRGILAALTAGAILLGGGPLHGQGIMAGAKAGMTIANLSESVDLDMFGFRIVSSSRTGFMGGAFATIPLAPALSFQPELLLVGKGVAVEVSYDDPFFGSGSIDGELRMTYLQVPLLARLDFLPPANPARAYLLGGPYIAFETDCTVSYTESGSGGSASATEDCGDDGRKKVDFGLDVGAGFGYAVGFGTLFLEARYALGFSDLSGDDEEGDDEFSDFGPSTLKHRVFGIVAGISIPVGRTR